MNNHPAGRRGNRGLRGLMFRDERRAVLTPSLSKVLGLGLTGNEVARVMVLARTKVEGARLLSRAGMPAMPNHLVSATGPDAGKVLNGMCTGPQVGDYEGAVFAWAKHSFSDRHLLMFPPGFRDTQSFHSVGHWEAGDGNRWHRLITIYKDAEEALPHERMVGRLFKFADSTGTDQAGGRMGGTRTGFPSGVSVFERRNDIHVVGLGWVKPDQAVDLIEALAGALEHLRKRDER